MLSKPKIGADEICFLRLFASLCFFMVSFSRWDLEALSFNDFAPKNQRKTLAEGRSLLPSNGLLSAFARAWLAVFLAVVCMKAEAGHHMTDDNPRTYLIL